MDLETLSNRILDSKYGLELEHSDDIFEDDSPPEINVESNELTHYGVKGMKWGVRKDRKKSGRSNRTSAVAKFLRGQRQNESNKDYQTRKKREHEEKMAKIASKERIASQKLVLKSQEKQWKAEQAARKEAESKEAIERKNREEQARGKQTISNTDKGKKAQKLSDLTDQEVRDAIARMQLERQYKDLAKKRQSEGEKFVKSVLNDAGKKIAVAYTVKYATKGIDALIKKASNKKNASGSGSGGGGTP